MPLYGDQVEAKPVLKIWKFLILSQRKYRQVRYTAHTLDGKAFGNLKWLISPNHPEWLWEMNTSWRALIWSTTNQPAWVVHRAWNFIFEHVRPFSFSFRRKILKLMGNFCMAARLRPACNISLSVLRVNWKFFQATKVNPVVIFFPEMSTGKNNQFSKFTLSGYTIIKAIAKGFTKGFTEFNNNKNRNA